MPKRCPRPAAGHPGEAKGGRAGRGAEHGAPRTAPVRVARVHVQGHACARGCVAQQGTCGAVRERTAGREVLQGVPGGLCRSRRVGEHLHPLGVPPRSTSSVGLSRRRSVRGTGLPGVAHSPGEGTGVGPGLQTHRAVLVAGPSPHSPPPRALPGTLSLCRGACAPRPLCLWPVGAAGCGVRHAAELRQDPCCGARPHRLRGPGWPACWRLSELLIRIPSPCVLPQPSDTFSIHPSIHPGIAARPLLGLRFPSPSSPPKESPPVPVPFPVLPRQRPRHVGSVGSSRLLGRPVPRPLECSSGSSPLAATAALAAGRPGRSGVRPCAW